MPFLLELSTRDVIKMATNLVIFRLPRLDDALSEHSFWFPGDFEGNVNGW